MLEPRYEACVFGDLVFHGRVDAWGKLVLDPEVFSDWPDSFHLLSPDEIEDAPTVAQWLEDCVSFERGGARHFLDVRLEAGGEAGALRVRGFVDEEEYEAYRCPLATMFRLAGAVGAKGALTLVSKPWDPFVFGYRVEVEPGVSHVYTLREEDLARLPDRAALDEIVARVQRAAASPAGPALRPRRATLPGV